MKYILELYLDESEPRHIAVEGNSKESILEQFLNLQKETKLNKSYSFPFEGYRCDIFEKLSLQDIYTPDEFWEYLK